MTKPSLTKLLDALRAAEKRGRQHAAAGSQALAAPSEGSTNQALVAKSVAANAVVLPAASPNPAALSPQVPGAIAPGGNAIVEPAAGGAVPAPPPPVAAIPPTEKALRAMKIRRFVTELLRPENKYNAGAAYNKVFPESKSTSARTGAVRWLAQDDVLEELDRQLKGIDASADMDETWVYRQWRSIANANMFDLLQVNKEGQFQGFTMAPEDWSREQQMTVKKLTFHANGRINQIEIIDRMKAVDSVAKARKLFVYDDSGTAVTDLAKLLTERMHAAAKRTGRTFDGETGQLVREQA